MHVRYYDRSRGYVLFAYLKNAITTFVFYEVHYCDFCVSTVQSKYPPYLGKIVHNIELC